MDALGGYGSGSDDDGTTGQHAGDNSVTLTPKLLGSNITAAPLVVPVITSKTEYVSTAVTVVGANPTASELYTPVQGPAHPFKKTATAAGPTSGTTLTGVFQRDHVDDQAFDQQFHAFTAKGFALDPSGRGGYVGSQSMFMQTGGAHMLSALKPAKQQKFKYRKQKNEFKDVELGDSADPWAPEAPEEEDNEAPALVGLAAVVDTALAAGAKPVAALTAAEETKEAAPKPKKEAIDISAGMKPAQCTSKFHGHDQFDYQGRSWVEPPKGLRAGSMDLDCFIPKKKIFQYKGHNGSVPTLAFMPNYGHLLLSGCTDGKVKIWSVHDERQCKRTYIGHTAGVRDVTFSDDGRQFLTSSYDTHVKLWDTETGKCLSTFTNNKTPNCARFRPGENNSFIVGNSSKEVLQYDCRTGSQEYVYDYHESSVNAVLFVDEGRRFVSSGDDKKVLVWEWNTNVPIKYISEPDMFSIPTLAMHPDGNSFVGQSLDNKICVFGISNNFRQMDKTFKGHVTTGYASHIAFSPNGQFVSSGDAEGRLFFWEWKTSKICRKLEGHQGASLAVAWDPASPSQVASSGMDGIIRLWK